jgi:hypothetical protein
MIGITAICEMIQSSITNEFDVSSSVAAKAAVFVFAWSVFAISGGQHQRQRSLLSGPLRSTELNLMCVALCIARELSRRVRQGE